MHPYRVFISYSHEDRETALKIEEHIRELPKTTLKREAERDAAEKTGWQRKEKQWVVAWRSDKS